MTGFDEYFSDEFSKSLPDDPVEGLLRLCEKFNAVFVNTGGMSDFNRFLKGYALIVAFVNERRPPVNDPPKLTGTDAGQNVEMIRGVVSQWREQAATLVRQRFTSVGLKTALAEFSGRFGKTIVFELSDSDIQNIQRLLNELRDLIAAADDDDLSPEHKQRLISRVEAVQSELHKKMSDFDRIMGLVMDVSIAAKQVGNNLKPLSRRVMEMF